VTRPSGRASWWWRFEDWQGVPTAGSSWQAYEPRWRPTTFAGKRFPMPGVPCVAGARATSFLLGRKMVVAWRALVCVRAARPSTSPAS